VSLACKKQRRRFLAALNPNVLGTTDKQFKITTRQSFAAQQFLGRNAKSGDFSPL